MSGLTNAEQKTLLEFFQRPQPVDFPPTDTSPGFRFGGLRAKGMSKKRAKQYLTGLLNVAYEAEQREREEQEGRGA